jgi:hypothetical protein
MVGGGRIGVGGVVGNIPDAVWVAGGMSGGLSGIFPTQFGWVVSGPDSTYDTTKAGAEVLH